MIFYSKLKTVNDADKQAILCNELKAYILRIIQEMEAGMNIQRKLHVSLGNIKTPLNPHNIGQNTPRTPRSPNNPFNTQNHYQESTPKIQLLKQENQKMTGCHFIFFH